LVGTKEIIGIKHSDEIMSWAKELGIQKPIQQMKFHGVDFSWLMYAKKQD
jgi:hypothetical protein